MTTNKETKKDLFARIDQVKAEALEETEAFSNKRSSEQRAIEELSSEIEILKEQFEEASAGDNDELALSLLTKQKQKEIELEMQLKKQTTFDERRREAIFKPEANKIVRAKAELHSYAIEDIAPIAAELLAVMEEYSGKEEVLRCQLGDMAFDCGVVSCKSHLDASRDCYYSVKNSTLGLGLYKAVKKWLDAYNGDPNTLFKRGHL